MKRNKFVSGEKKPRPKCFSKGCNNLAELQERFCIHCLMERIELPKTQASREIKDYFTYNDYSRSKNRL